MYRLTVAGLTWPHGACVVVPRCGKPGPQCRELLSQNPARPALQPVDDLRHAQRRVALDEQVNVVRHVLQCEERHALLVRNLGKELSQPNGYLAGKHLPAILRTPDQMILEREDRTWVPGIPVSHQGDIQAADAYCNKGRAFTCRLNATVPCASSMEDSTPARYATIAVTVVRATAVRKAKGPTTVSVLRSADGHGRGAFRSWSGT